MTLLILLTGDLGKDNCCRHFLRRSIYLGRQGNYMMEIGNWFEDWRMEIVSELGIKNSIMTRIIELILLNKYWQLT